MSKCEKCILFGNCIIVVVNKGKPYDKCLGPIFLDPEEPEEGRKEILKVLKEKNLNGS